LSTPAETEIDAVTQAPTPAGAEPGAAPLTLATDRDGVEGERGGRLGVKGGQVPATISARNTQPVVANEEDEAEEETRSRANLEGNMEAETAAVERGNENGGEDDTKIVVAEKLVRGGGKGAGAGGRTKRQRGGTTKAVATAVAAAGGAERTTRRSGDTKGTSSTKRRR